MPQGEGDFASTRGCTRGPAFRAHCALPGPAAPRARRLQLAVHALLAMLVTLAAVSSACAPVRPVEREGGTLAIGVPFLPDLDPHRASHPHPLFRMVYDTLLTKQPDLSYAAGLASEWRVSPDGCEVLLHLRVGVTFHDGTRLDGEAVAANIERVLSGNVSEFPVRALLGPLREVRASELTVTLVYDHPFPPVWEALSDSRLGIVSPAALAAADGTAGLAGSGPFVPSERSGAELCLRRFAAYRWPPAGTRNPGPAYPEQIKVYGLDGSDGRMPGGGISSGAGADGSGGAGGGSTVLVEPGSLDVVWWPAGQPLPAELREGTAGWRSNSFAGTHLVYVSCVLSDPVLADPVVRQALRLLVDRRALEGLPAWPAAATAGLLPSSLGGAMGEVSGPDAGAAARMLSAAGWVPGADGVRGKGGVRLEIRLATYEGDPTYEAVGAMLRAAFGAAGFDCRLVPARRTAQPGLVRGAPNLWLLFHEWPDPDVLYYLFHSSQIGRANRAAYGSPVADWLLEVARTEMDPMARLDLYRQAQAVIVGDAVAFGLFEARGQLLISQRVVGVRPHPAGEFFVYDVYLRNQDGAR